MATHTPFAQRGYRLLMRTLTLPLLAWVWIRGAKDTGYRERIMERLGFVEAQPSSMAGLWIHAASVGEVQATRPLITALLAHWPPHTITVSTQSPTGARALHSLWGDQIRHVYAPIDTPGATRRFLRRLQPSMLVLIEREIWPEMLSQCRQIGLPVALVNARLSDDSAQFYQRWRSLMAPIWTQLALVAAADAPSIGHYRDLGVPDDRLVLTGNLKFDQDNSAQTREHLPWLEGRPILVAGSTHEGEEAALLAAWPEFARQHPSSLLILVPRHPERFDSVAEQIKASGLAFTRRSVGDLPTPDTQVLLADTMGELSLWYAHASVCFIGGSLVHIGGHNALEAMACAKPVLFGPHTHHFQELYQDVETCGGGERIDSARLLLRKASQWIRDKALLHRMGQQALDFVVRQQGSSTRSLDALKALWGPMQAHRLFPVTTHILGSTTIWCDTKTVGATAQGLFDAPADTTRAMATGSGRGQAYRIPLEDGEGVLRHYRRGGWMARVVADRYWGLATASGRAMAEFSLLRRLNALGLPVPAPVAAREIRSAGTYTADIVVAMIANSRNVAEILSTQTLTAQSWRTLGAAVAELHKHQVFHADLNCHNLLLDHQGKAWVVDFDKCRVRAGDNWKLKNLERLLRSLRKELARRPAFHWDEASWAELMAGYRSVDSLGGD